MFLDECPIASGIFSEEVINLSRRRPLSYRNQSIDLVRKSMDWFLFDNALRLVRVKCYFLVVSYSNYVVYHCFFLPAKDLDCKYLFLNLDRFIIFVCRLLVNLKDSFLETFNYHFYHMCKFLYLPQIYNYGKRLRIA